MADVKLEFVHKAVIIVIFTSLFAFFFMIMGIVFTALGFTSHYAMFRTMGPIMLGFAFLMVGISAFLGYKVHTIRTQQGLERRRQLTIVQRANSLMFSGYRGPYSESQVTSSNRHSMTYPNQSTSSDPRGNDYQTASKAYSQQPTGTSLNNSTSSDPNASYTAASLPVEKSAQNVSYSPFPQAMAGSPMAAMEEKRSSQTSLAGVPATTTMFGASETASRGSPVVLTADQLTSSRPMRPQPSRPAPQLRY